MYNFDTAWKIQFNGYNVKATSFVSAVLADDLLSRHEN
jgi:hypothetical protein